MVNKACKAFAHTPREKHEWDCENSIRFKRPLSLLDISTRHNISKDIRGHNVKGHNVKQKKLELIDLNRNFHPQKSEYIFLYITFKGISLTYENLQT